jgi:hypothetical protein
MVTLEKKVSAVALKHLVSLSSARLRRRLHPRRPMRQAATFSTSWSDF